VQRAFSETHVSSLDFSGLTLFIELILYSLSKSESVESNGQDKLAVLGTLRQLEDHHQTGRPAAAAVAAASLIFLVRTSLCLRDQKKRWRILIWMMITLCALNLAVINLRWNLWMQGYKQTPFYNAGSDLSRWTMKLIIAAIMAALLLLFSHLDSRQRKNAQ